MVSQLPPAAAAAAAAAAAVADAAAAAAAAAAAVAAAASLEIMLYDIQLPIFVNFLDKLYGLRDCPKLS